MVSFKSLLYASAIFAVSAFAAPHAEPESLEPTPASLGERATRIAPRCWRGTQFPAPSNWLPYGELFQIARGAMVYGNDTNAEIAAIDQSIRSIAASSGIDPRFILAVMRRESDGRVTIPCGDMGRSCGLMQVHGVGVPSCPRHPCPSATIHKMIQCGVTGCQGASIRECRGRFSRWGAIARCYNTGTVPNLNDWTIAGQYGIRPYVQDIANLLLGADYGTWSKFDDGRCGYQ